MIDHSDDHHRKNSDGPSPSEEESPAGENPSSEEVSSEKKEREKQREEESKKSSFSFGLRLGLSTLLVTLFFLAGVGVFRFLLTFRKKPERTSKAQPQIAVKTYRLHRRDFREPLSGYGTVRSRNRTRVEAEVSALVKWISPHLEGGQKVKKGQKLVRLDDRDYQKAVNKARLRLKQAQRNKKKIEETLASLKEQIDLAGEELDRSQQELDRQKKLRQARRVSASELDRQYQETTQRKRFLVSLNQQLLQRKREAKEAADLVEIRREELSESKIRLDRTVITAPYSGQIEARHVHLGARVGPGVALFDIVDTYNLEVPITLNAADYHHISLNSQVTLRRPGKPRLLWRGKINRIAPQIKDRERTFEIFLEIKIDGQKKDLTSSLPPGTFLKAEVEGRFFRDVFVLPRAAFMEGKIFMISKTKEAKKGPLQGQVKVFEPTVLAWLPDLAVVKKGLNPEELLVVTGVEEVSQGSQVKIVSIATDLEELTGRPLSSEEKTSPKEEEGK